MSQWELPKFITQLLERENLFILAYRCGRNRGWHQYWSFNLCVWEKKTIMEGIERWKVKYKKNKNLASSI